MLSTKRRASEMLNVVEVETRQFVLDNDILEKISKLMLGEFRKGLAKDPPEDSTVKMLLTYVRDVPDGSESGKYLGLDLGGSNFRVLSIDLEPNSTEINMQSEKFEIPPAIMMGSGDKLFEHIAECLGIFLKNQNLESSHLPLGFTFSFPCIQTNLVSAKLVRWTKGFCCSGVVSEDVIQLLRRAIERRNDINLDVIAVLNDTTGTLMSCAHKDKNCRIGLIIGTGVNACYMEDLRYVEKWPEDDTSEPRQVVINTEWGAFGDNNCLNFMRTKYDIMIDNSSINPREQLFEKMISGYYLGEIVRLIMLDFAKCKLIFKGNVTEKLNEPFSFKTAWLSQIQEDFDNNKCTETEKILKELDVAESTKDDCEAVKVICLRVVERAAFLVSAGIATLLCKMRRPETTIGVDGSVYRLHPTFRKIMEKKIKELIPPEYKFKLMLSEDGSGRGAALVAAVAVRQAKNINL